MKEINIVLKAHKALTEDLMHDIAKTGSQIFEDAYIALLKRDGPSVGVKACAEVGGLYYKYTTFIDRKSDSRPFMTVEELDEDGFLDLINEEEKAAEGDPLKETGWTEVGQNEDEVDLKPGDLPE